MSEEHESPDAALTLPSGRRIEIDPSGEDRINISSPDGTFELAIAFTAAGPVLRLSAAALELRTTGALRLSCEDLAIEVQRSMVVRAGTLSEQIEGKRTSVVGGQSTLEAHAVGVRARLGDIALDANDNVRASGEKILLNS